MQSKDISVPVGAVLPYTGNLGNNQLNEMGWSIYDDSELQISNYPTLFAAIGTCNGGNGNTRFNLPDYASEIVIVDTQELADQLHGDHGVVKLFYEQHYKYGCYSQNWGASKGQDHYQDVCVVLGAKAWKQYQEGTLHESVAQTRNKLYVAFSRARGGVYIVPDKLFKAYKT
ncbi:tail fiber protein [Pseudomonas donghuensis]|uniref:tail fiber protein n=1 Tax=Pseudomonas donghuensis TaxID=1163398 RepID=UPI00029AF238|nr:tail fiber protein [Pseudomonas donghuensis]